MSMELLRIVVNTTQDEQRDKILEEAIELSKATTTTEIINEAFDVLQATLTYLDRYFDPELEYDARVLRQKLEHRGWKTHGLWVIERLGK